ncbi:MAG: hypothetical protein IIA72_17390, partial [Proteobacteria bacterium]|nr:hypothetical protein [Pseudomonadota bacterium]
MRGIMAGVAGAAGIGFMIKKSIEFADKIGKTADQIGITTAALQEYRFALDLSGVATETTDKGLTKFVRNMGELGKTSNAVKDVLKDIDPVLLANLRSFETVEDQLAAVFSALAGYTTQQKRAAVAAALFGRAGVKMTVAVKNGIVAFEALRQRARDLGLILEDKLIRNAEKANDELTVLAEVIKVKLVGAVIAFAPQIADLAQQFADAIPKIIGAAEAFGRFVGLFEARPAERIRELSEEIARLQQQIGAQRGDFIPDFLQFNLPDLEKTLLKKRAELSDLIRETSRIGVPGARPKPGAPAPGARQGELIKFPGREDVIGSVRGLEQAARANRDLLSAELNAAEAIRLTTIEMNRQADQTLVLTTATAQGEAALRAQTEIFELQNAALAQGIDLTAAQGQEWEAAFRRVQIFNRGLEETQNELAETARQAELLAASIDSVIGEALAGNIRSWKDLGRVAIGVIQDILRE